MTATYPGAIKSYTAKIDNVDRVMAADINSPYEEITAMQTAIGIDPIWSPGGRLTLTSGSPVPTTDTSTTDATTIYYTPFVTNRVSLYNGTIWTAYQFSETSVAVPATSDTNYDVFAYASTDSAVTLETVAWSNATTRAAAISMTDGLYVESTDTTRLYLGTIRTTGTAGQCEDSATKRFVWNYYNRRLRKLYVTESTGHTINGVFRLWNNSATNNQLDFVVGLLEDAINTSISATIKAGADGSYVSVILYNNGAAIDSSAEVFNYNNQLFTACISQPAVYPALGYNYLQGYERGNHASNNSDDLVINAAILA